MAAGRNRSVLEMPRFVWEGAQPPMVHPTIVAAHLDLGANNALFIRGQGAGLNWERGQPLTWIDSMTWVWSARSPREVLEFQLLLNDEVWEKGLPHFVGPGDSIELTPDFEWPEIPRTSLPEGVYHPRV